MHDIAGKVIGILLAFVLVVVATFTISVTTAEMIDRRSAFMVMCEFVDGVIDSRQITEAELREFNSKIQSFGMTMDYTITREMRSVDPDPLNPGSYVRTYIATDNNYVYNQGDHITLHVRSIGYSSSLALAHSITNMFVEPFDEIITARIR